ncbi:MAG: hypothetical protein ACREFZ_06655 [Acetobacteraceae bacterium]
MPEGSRVNLHLRPEDGKDEGVTANGFLTLKQCCSVVEEISVRRWTTGRPRAAPSVPEKPTRTSDVR